MLRNTMTGILGVDPSVRESALAMGMTERQMLFEVEMPLAAPTILAGIRIAVGNHDRDGDHRGGYRRGRAGGLHFSRNRDGGYDADSGGRRAGRHHGPGRPTRDWDGSSDRLSRYAAVLLLAGCGKPHGIVVGSKNFTEQDILGEILAQHIERRLRVPVERKPHIGGTLLAHQALVSGAIDLYPEYTGTALTAILKLPTERDPATTFRSVAAEYAKRWRLSWMPPFGFNNTFAMTVRGETARARKVATLSEAARAGTWSLGAGYEFVQRPDGLAGLEKTYSLRMQARPVTMDLGLLYQALLAGKVEMVAASSTDGLLVGAGPGGPARRSTLLSTLRMRRGGARADSRRASRVARCVGRTGGEYLRADHAEAQLSRRRRAPAGPRHCVGVSGPVVADPAAVILRTNRTVKFTA